MPVFKDSLNVTANAGGVVVINGQARLTKADFDPLLTLLKTEFRKAKQLRLAAAESALKDAQAEVSRLTTEIDILKNPAG